MEASSSTVGSRKSLCPAYPFSFKDRNIPLPITDDSVTVKIETKVLLDALTFLKSEVEILQLESDIRLREEMIEILESDYPKEPEPKPEYYEHESGIFARRNIAP